MKTESMGTINKPVCDEKSHVEPWVKSKDRVEHGNCQKADNSLWADADEKVKLATDDELREWTEELGVFVYPVRT